MSGSPGAQEALSALERLHAKHVITLDEGQAAARLLSGDEGYVFPKPRAAPEPAPAAAPEAAASPATPPAEPAPEAPSGTENGTPPT